MSESVWTRPVPPRVWFYLVLVLVIGSSWGLGNYHIISSSDPEWGSIQLVRKVHFSFSECFVSLDTIMTQPSIIARVKYPLTIKALQRDGFLESDEEREARIQMEVEEKLREAQREAEKMMKDWMR